MHDIAGPLVSANMYAKAFAYGCPDLIFIPFSAGYCAFPPLNLGLVVGLIGQGFG